MLKKVLIVSLLSLVLSLLPASFQSANAIDELWQPGIANDLYGSDAGLVPGAGIRNTGLLVYKSNPDELIMKIIMNDSFEDKPFSGKGRNMAMWIYWTKDYCWSEGKANCEGLFTVGEPFNPSSYPSIKSSEYVIIQQHEKAGNVNVKPTSCKAPWWIESTYRSRDTWSFALSITCLKIPKEFGWYAFSQIDIGQKNVVSSFTQVQTISYPFWELAAQTAKSSSISGENKDEAIASFSKIVLSTKKQANALKLLVSKSKAISRTKKNSYLKTLKEFDNYAKLADVQSKELNNQGVNFELVINNYIQEWSAWNKKLMSIVSSLNKV